MEHEFFQDGFPRGEVRFTTWDDELKGFILNAALGTFMTEGRDVPQPLKQTFHLGITIPTDLPGPLEDDGNLTLKLLLPMDKVEFTGFVNPVLPSPAAVRRDFFLETPTEDTETTEQDFLQSVRSLERTSLVSLFKEVDNEEQVKLASDYDVKTVLESMAHLNRAEQLRGIAERLPGIIGLDEFLEQHGVPLPFMSSPADSYSIGVSAAFEVSDTRYPLVTSTNDTVPGEDGTRIHATQYTSPVNGSEHFPPAEEPADESWGVWREQNRLDVGYASEVLSKAADKVQATVGEKLADLHLGSRLVHPADKSYVPYYFMQKRAAFFEGHQQLAQPGIHLLHSAVRQPVHGYGYNVDAELHVAHKASMETIPNHITLEADDDLNTPPQIVRHEWPFTIQDTDDYLYRSGIHGMKSDPNDVSMQESLSRKEYQWLRDSRVAALTSQGFTEQDIASIQAGKKVVGETPASFTHDNMNDVMSFLAQYQPTN